MKKIDELIDRAKYHEHLLCALRDDLLTMRYNMEERSNSDLPKTILLWLCCLLLGVLCISFLFF
jgi:hypothetical protein